MFDELPFHADLNAKHIGVILGDIFETWDNAAYSEYLDRFNLPRKKRIGDFFKGMKMKLQIAAALSHGARLLLLDEATTGLDPVVRNEILDIFLEYLQDENNSILMSSHITTDLEKIADSVTFIDKGRILLSGYKDDILDTHAVIRCKKSDSEDIVSIRKSEYGADVMVYNREKCLKKYSGLTIENTTLEEIVLFYVRREKKEWF